MVNLLVSVLESFLGDHRKLNEDTGQVNLLCSKSLFYLYYKF